MSPSPGCRTDSRAPSDSEKHPGGTPWHDRLDRLFRDSTASRINRFDGPADARKALFDDDVGCAFEACQGPGGKGLGDVTRDDPWMALHRIRWGNPGATMPSGVADAELSLQDPVDVLTYAQTLPAPP